MTGPLGYGRSRRSKLYVPLDEFRRCGVSEETLRALVAMGDLADWRRRLTEVVDMVQAGGRFETLRELLAFVRDPVLGEAGSWIAVDVGDRLELAVGFATLAQPVVSPPTGAMLLGPEADRDWRALRDRIRGDRQAAAQLLRHVGSERTGAVRSGVNLFLRLARRTPCVWDPLPHVTETLVTELQARYGSAVAAAHVREALGEADPWPPDLREMRETIRAFAFEIEHWSDV